ncbi:CDP-glucose 4,6-dehydratase [Candidatus Saganbacteria bacterium]|nr:CDP-glucose 4,6-dehydratase [Candidatus Saganbacteria bacterium]
MTNFWKDKRVFITGHTGFKGSWLCLMLDHFGANITGYALNPSTEPCLYDLCNLDKSVRSIIADIRDKDRIKAEIKKAQPEIVIHMAAQPIVRDSYVIPVETYEINIFGTVNLLEAVRACNSVKAAINITTDKVYENKGQAPMRKSGQGSRGFRENDPLGGYDPYSSSKACSEIVTASYRDSFGLNIATARAGNVIGGGDWASDRLVPDFIRAISKSEKILIRNPKAVRPWQHVLEPLTGYLLLARKLYEKPGKFAEAWNFGPKKKDAKPVIWLTKELCKKWGNGACYEMAKGKHPHEAHYLMLDASKSRSRLKWRPKLGLEKALDMVIDFTKAYAAGKDIREVCLKQIEGYYGK